MMPSATLTRAIVGGIFTVLVGGICIQAAWVPVAAQPKLSLQASSPQTQSAVPAALSPADQRAMLDKYCVTCHNERLKTAGLMLDKADIGKVASGADVWEKVVRKVRSGAMPPAGAPRPDNAASHAFVSSLETSLDRSAAAAPNPGRPAIRRLNRAEYTNAIRDLLAVEVDGRSLLPTDESGYGFDNNGDTLTLSPALLGRYLSAAQKISRLAVGDPTIRPSVQRFNLSKLVIQDDRMSEGLPFGSRGGGVVTYNFPLDGEYVVKVRLRRTFNTLVPFGAANREKLDVRLDGARLRFFEVGGECEGRSDAPECVRPRYRSGGPNEYERDIDLPLEVRFLAKAGARQIGVAFQKHTAAAIEGGGPSREPNGHGDTEMSVDYLLVEGPMGTTTPGDTASRRKIFVCQPAGAQDEEACATKILSTLARRAYRRPVVDRDVQPLVGLFRTARADRGFEPAIQFAIEGVLVSPNFLTRVERDPIVAAPRTAGRITDIELASRLSFFLWSTIPDDELLDTAVAGKLSNAQVLEQQVRRMIRDPKASALVSNFGGQWLYLRNMRGVNPDPRQYPEFSENLRDAFLRETELFLESQIQDDHGLTELLTADYTFVNEPLAKFYDIPNVFGTHFRRVTLTDENRFGLLGKASILTVTSYATRTSPVLRGKYMLENFLGAPPPPPPGDVNTDLTQKPGDEVRSVRERLEAHRKNPVCSSCHSRMDPLGFALENFDGIGKWRTTEARRPIDSSAVMPDGTRFSGPAEFRKVLLSRRQEFVDTVTEKLLTYALGRGTEYYDRPALRKIVRDAAPSDYRWSSLILGIVKSTPFQMRPAQQKSPSEGISAQAR